MQQLDFTVIDNTQIAKDIYRLQFSILNSQFSIPTPGSFVNLQIDGFYLRRPISVCDCNKSALTLIYKIAGQGTVRLARYKAGETINALTGLGNGYTIVPAERPLLVGGGVGVPPLYYLAKELVKAGQKPIALLGFNCAEESFYVKEFEAVCETIVKVGGYVTDALPGLRYDALYCCGPEPMLKAVYTQAGDVPAQFSFEARMACGFGACMGCSCKTVDGYKRICKDGPVLRREEILWK